ncbi:class I SAM-dependent methyltransferase [Phenylobacterium sp.]|jgi:predicted methyltransferase|uniref:class I SAM-dependent methyltransferase n=1 Tax=Phenylobacterium sp. TaxID=1871053 RepID=UPI0037C5F2B0
MRSNLLLVAAAAMALSSGLAQAAPSAAIVAAVADKGRPEADTKRDADRKPAEMLEFAGVKPGSKVADFIPGGGYFTRIFAKAVGPKGKVYAVTNPPPATATTLPAIFGIAADPQYGNITVVQTGIANFAVPEQVDVFWTAQNYHDLFARARNVDVSKVDKLIFDAIKPGGVFIVLDHAAAPGTPIDPDDKLHRIDPAHVKAQLISSGFKFEGESTVLRNPNDDHTKGVFDPAIRGKTDQFIYKFRKPR